MLKIKQAIVVEGKYDKIRLENIVDAPIITTNGFAVFNDKEKAAFIRAVCEKRGIVVLTDSDGAGFVIRSHLKGIADNSKILHAYIPQIKGREKRKTSASKEGFLGVEGVTDDIILSAIKKSGAEILDDESSLVEKKREITKSDFFLLGLSGANNSSKRRGELLKALDLPSYMSANALLSAVNIFLSYDEFVSLCNKL